MSERAPLPATSGALTTPLAWALAVSVVVHTTLVVMPGTWPHRESTAAADRGDLLQVALVPPEEKKAEQPTERPPELVAPPAPSPATLPAEQLPPAPAAETAAPIVAPSNLNPEASRPLAIRGAADMDVDGKQLADKSRLGDYLARQMTEFPVEVDFPVRLGDVIHVHYPPAAAIAGRQDSVVLWIVVDAAGAPDEIAVVEGSQEFADAVVAAVKAAHFLPARNNLQPIRFPLALEFNFTAGNSATASAANVQINR